MTNRLLTYNPKLDSLRAIAVILVIAQHWIPNNRILNFLPKGMMGVTLFFVLSGYLITSILFHSRNSWEKSHKNTGEKKINLIKTFFIRRILRIFPIYYLTLIVLLICKAEFISEYWPYLFTYTQNFLYFKLNTWPGEFSHLWTLAIEEQYYLIWPWLVIFISREYYFKLLLAMIALGVFSSGILYFLLPGNRFYQILLFPSFTAFGFGGLIAYVKINKIKLESYSAFKIAFIISITMFLISVIMRITHIQTELFITVSFFIIYLLTLKNNWFVTHIFSIKPIVFIGKISYGLYLYHNFVLMYYNKLSSKYSDIYIFYNQFKIFPTISNPFQRLLWLSILLLILSIVSWYTIEKPINNMKKYFSYK